MFYLMQWKNIKINISDLGYVGHKNALCENETIEDFVAFWKKIYNFER